MKLTLFDLDHTLLSGDSDVLWCDFLIARGLLNPAEFAARNQDMETRYKAGTVGLDEFANFYASTLAGRSAPSWQAEREAFLNQWIIPRVPQSARDLVRWHQEQGDLVVLTTATNRFITELTARHLGIEYVIATELDMDGEIFSGKACGVLNMREGKPARLASWLAARGATLAEYESTAYSDSINDLPLLKAVNHPVAVDPDARLEAIALACGWPVLRLQRDAL